MREPLLAQFLSWHGIAAICAGLILLGFLIDWLLRLRRKQAILKWLREREDKLAAIPIAEWQLVVAKSALVFWSCITRPFEKIYDWRRSFFQYVPHPIRLEKGSWVGGTIGRLLQAGRVWATTLLWSMYIIVPTTIFVLLIMGLWVVAFEERLALTNESIHNLNVNLGGPLNVVWAPLLFSLALRSVLDTACVLIGKREVSSWLRKVEEFLLKKLLPVAVVSSLITFGALMVAYALPLDAKLPDWMEPDSARQLYSIIGAHTLHLSSLSIINFLFDLATVLVSIRLLGWMVKRKRGMILVATLDLASSAALAVGLFAILRSIELGLSVDRLKEAWMWLMSVATFTVDTGDSYSWLTPVLLTTFLPVVIYSSAVILLGFVLQPAMRVSGYFCGLLGEKKNTPFLELSFVLSALTAAGKTFADWPWLASRVQGIIG